MRVEGAQDRIGAPLGHGPAVRTTFSSAVDLCSDDTATIGILLRYRDSGNYYRSLSFDAAAGFADS